MVCCMALRAWGISKAAGAGAASCPEFRLAHNHRGTSAVTFASELGSFALGLSVVGCLAVT